MSIISCDHLIPRETRVSSAGKKELDAIPDSTKYRLKVQGKVVEITDGDTFVLLDQNENQFKIRLHEIDAPETTKNQRYSKQARKALSDLILGDTVDVYHKIGTNGSNWNRIVGVVYVENINVNSEMIRLGFAWHSKKYSFGYSSDSLELDSLERVARSRRLGLWKDDSPVPPWIKRKEKNN